jgi:N-acetyl sugar amidotransferase
LTKDIPELFKGLKEINPNEKIVYCKRCVVSNQRPRISFNDDGVCSACLWTEFKRTKVDWDKKEKELEEVCDKFRSNDGSWDIIIPGSGGKDSSHVSYIMKKKYGMHPLTVTWASALPTEIGTQNLFNFIQAGFDNLMGTPNGEVHRKLSRLAFEEFGDNFLPFIYGQLNFPSQVAVNYNIPFIMFGEAGDVEYGGAIDHYDEPKLQWNFIEETDMTNLPPEYWKKHGLTDEQLQFYKAPNLKEIKSKGIEAHYFSYYEDWKPESHLEVSSKHLGFKPEPSGKSEGTYTNFASLDDKTDCFHYHMAFIKFGIGRATSDAAHQIRDEIITRDEGVELVHKYDHEFPKQYLNDTLEYLDLNLEKLHQIIDKFRRPIIWKKENNEWKLNSIVSKL